ncbi:MAG: dipeptide ABC transporter ATP-binding protein [Gammaproteobacteria bacterium]|jgi:oligopeptide/dipeptide ABC transporter ATP-binding protein|nr:dipeptide ABC transporter ATP-binding protein [Gammaproteobacteria bacterium]MDP6616841.1 dipeptide ABC transporter ATP-binding protein [Gammaproteobacteria bacterium]MDP6694599.1 dipeptide ABC transporter ATP-binding protein [Gammaproteobacteria bacterium]
MNPTPESSDSVLLQVRDLKKYFPVRGGWFRGVQQQLKAVDGISFALHSGRTLGLVGESGCGKSTLGRALLNLHPPTAGDVLLDGLPLAGLSRQALFARRRDMQIIFQDPFASLSPRRTVAQIVREPLDVHRLGTQRERRRRVEELLGVVGLRSNALNRYPHEFSGGQRQRIGIARALALKPRFIVADEPVSALDVSVQSQVLNLIGKLQAELGIAFLFISHDLAVIRHISDEVAVMYLGKFVEHAPAEKIFAAPKHPYTKALLSSIPVPDPANKSPRMVLEGDVPSPMNPPAGCPFHPRCPIATERCRIEVPALRESQTDSEHVVGCYLAT